MTDLLLTVLATALVAGIGFGVAAFVLERTPGLSEPQPDGVSRPLPEERQLTGADVRALRFDLAIRGYRMAQVDAALHRLATELEQTKQRVAELEDQVAAGTVRA